MFLKSGMVVDAALIAAPISTKNKDKSRDPVMHSSKKGNQWYFDMKAHIGADAESCLVHSVGSTSGHAGDIAEGNALLYGLEAVAFGDAGCKSVEKRADAKAQARWHIAMQPGKRRALDKNDQADVLIDQTEKLKASVRAKVEHPYQVIKCQLEYARVRYRGLKKNKAQLFTLFALFNLLMVRGKLMTAQE